MKISVKILPLSINDWTTGFETQKLFT